MRARVLTWPWSPIRTPLIRFLDLDEESKIASLHSHLPMQNFPLLVLTITTCQGITLRHGAGVQMFDKNGKSHMFTSRKAAMGAGMLTGHFPDVDSCHSACQAAMGCGHDQECLCNCCDVGAMENDGCFCYSCGPMGAPQTLWSEHENVNPRSNPLNSSEEPDQCTGTKQMCGGMFGDTRAGMRV